MGRVRKNNQDSGFASPHLLVIADGVGGAARGDIASSTAVQILRRLDAPAPEDMQEALAGAIHRTHDRLAELVDEDPELDGTSTTVTAALFDGTKIAVGHVGDSRGYLLRDGTLSQLTKDHTFVQSLIDEGRITEEESRTHPHRNLILRAVDGVHDTEPDLFYVELAPGDRILLCSDGCSGVLDADRLADILGTGSVDYAVVELVRASLEAGSTDNVTAVVADVVDAGDRRDPTPGAAAATGPMLVGAAAEQPRKTPMASKSFFRGHRSGDTGEMEPVAAGEPADRRPRGAALRPAAAAPLRLVPADRRARRAARASSPPAALLRLRLVAEAVLRRRRRRQGRDLPRHPGRPPRRHPAPRRARRTDVTMRVPARLPGRAGPRRHPRRRPGARPRDRRRDPHRLRAGLPDARSRRPPPSPPASPREVALGATGPRRTATKTDEPKRQPEPQPEPRARRRPIKPPELHRAPAPVTARGRGIVNSLNPLNALPHGFTHRRRRGAELFLLVLSLVVGVGAYAAVGLGVEGEVPVDILGYGGWLAALVHRLPRRGPLSSRRTPTRCCCRSWPPSTASGWR